MNNLILGAGFTGMAAGIKTGWPVYEATDKPGGICRNYEKEGFTFSNGGPHWVFGKGKGLDYIKTLTDLNTYQRKASIYYNVQFPYPIQDYAEMQQEPKKGTFQGWLGKNFSKELNNMFFYPFNDKYTAGLYRDTVQIDDYKTPTRGGTGTVVEFHDPVIGLTELVDRMADKNDIRYNKRVKSIDVDSKTVFFEDEAIDYDKIVSSIPLNQMMAMCGKTVELPYTSVLVINIGAEKAECTPTDHWVYVPFCTSGFYRLAFYSNVDEKRAPYGKVGLSVELAFPGMPPEKIDVLRATNEVIKELKLWRFIGDTVVVDPTYVRVAYSWLYNEKDKDDAIKWLKSRGITSTGRYGKWKFQGLVESIADGLEIQV